MLLVKKMNFSEKEINSMFNDLGGYVWVVLDVKKGIVAAGDEYVMDMKNALLKEKCSIRNIFGVGFDMTSGDIDFYSPVNIKWLDKESNKELPDEMRERVETLIRYFFIELPVFKKERKGKQS